MVRGGEFELGDQILRDYVESLGCGYRGAYGSWIDMDKDQYICTVASTDIIDLSTLPKDDSDQLPPDFWD